MALSHPSFRLYPHVSVPSTSACLLSEIAAIHYIGARPKNLQPGGRPSHHYTRRVAPRSSPQPLQFPPLSGPIRQTDAHSGDTSVKSDRNQIRAFNLANHRHIWTFSLT
ncbi:hypothetical protein CRENBAI_020773 [Crenichthys baileyi]|uniref:Uncharacterized protein n=1 Tax=Crenichthys baileyi TaxID=28760 RepID=A0AAV9QTM0_9TELE